MIAFSEMRVNIFPNKKLEWLTFTWNLLYDYALGSLLNGVRRTRRLG